MAGATRHGDRMRLLLGRLPFVPATLLSLVVVAPTLHAQVYKCEDAQGKTIYADSPCARGGKTLNVPNDAKSTPGEGSVCAQLLDERRRLAADAERNAQLGRPESASSVKRRQSLARQYARRCIGISRSHD